MPQSTYEEIIEWAHRLADWASDLFRRIHDNGEPQEKDIDDVCELLKKRTSAPNSPSDAQRFSSPPASVQPNSTFVFKSIGHLKNVNAICENQTLHFGESGLTVIFGYNGAGKSGYIRMLKEACFARNREENIFPHVLLTGSAAPASANFEWEQDGNPEAVTWSDGNDPIPALRSSVAIFDSKCARVYIDNENSVEIMPYGMDMLDMMKSGYKRISEKLKGQNDAISIPASEIMSVTKFAGTKAASFVQNLTGDPDEETRLDGLCDLSDKDRKRLQDLENALGQPDPLKRAKELNTALNLINALREKLRNFGRLLSDDAVCRAKKITDAFNAATTASHQFAKTLQNHLRETGGESWRLLIEAARKFSSEAYPEKSFPVTGSDAKCVLCQQQLEESGTNNLRKFDAFVQGEIESTRRKREQEFLSFQKQIEQDSVAQIVDNANLRDQICAYCGKSLWAEIEARVRYLVERKERLLSAMNSNCWNGTFPSANHPRIDEDIDRNRNAISDEINTLRDTAKKRAEVDIERNELAARQALLQIKDCAISRISRLREKRLLKECITAVSPLDITNASKQLLESHTADLSEAFNREISDFKRGQIPVKMTYPRALQGKQRSRIAIPNNTQSAKLGDVLSEGEHKAYAIAAFLAETTLYDTVRCIIFDDPVSSFDHKHSERVAKRFVKESAERQVIIFTHDQVFFDLLRIHAGQSRTQITPIAVCFEDKKSGIVTDPPFQLLSISGRFATLKKMRDGAKKLSGPERESMITGVCTQLRMTFEVIVEHKLLKGTMLRHSNEIKVGNLRAVFETDDLPEIVGELIELHREISSDSHSDSPESNPVAPNLDDLSDYIDRLESISKKL